MGIQLRGKHALYALSISLDKRKCSHA
jgi:hypothetical protein